MRILLLAPHPFYQHRGTLIAEKNLLHVLVKEGYHVEVLAYHEGEDPNIPGVPIHRIWAPAFIRNIPPGPSLKKAICDLIMLFSCFILIKNKRFSLLHAVEESVFIAAVMKWFFKIPYVYDMDSTLSQQLKEKSVAYIPVAWIFAALEKGAIRNSNGIIAVCRSLELYALKIAPAQRVCRLEDVSLLPSRLDTDVTNVDFPVDRTMGPIVLYVGNLESYQGIDLLLHSFSVALKSNKKIQLVIVGGAQSDIQNYRLLSKKLGIDSKVHFLGPHPVEDLAEILVKADVLASPRIQGNNTPMKIFSYLDSGKPLLATRLPTHTQVLDDEVACLVEPSPKSMAEGLLRMLGNPDYSNGLAERGRSLARREFSQGAFKKKLLEFYKELHSELNQHQRSQ